jgi:hypothetical protein
MTINYKSPGHLVRAVQDARVNPNTKFVVPGEWPLSGADILTNFRRGLMERCNRGLVIADDQKYIDMLCDGRVINDVAKRIRRSGRNLLRTPALIARYPQIHNPPLE